jgi:succinate dehydrogenase/fumarate reductase flavoprotein subunit
MDDKARGIIARDLVNGELERHFGHAVLLCTGGYGNVFYLSTNAMGSNVTAAWKAHKKGAFFGNPCFTQIHPTCIPVSGDHQSKLTLMSESPYGTMDGSGCQRKGTIPAKQTIFRKKKEIITWKEGILLSETWYPETLLPVLPKKDVMKVMV